MKQLLMLMALATLAFSAYAADAPSTSPAVKVTAPGSNNNGPKHDGKLPIEISSDTLEVLQHENKAIFKGNVVAVQGDIRLKSDVMVVHYKQKSDQPGQAPAPKPAPPPAGVNDQGEMGAITKIDVEGNVFVATPEESAKGDTGDYDVASKTIHLFGTNVILTRAKNILRGTALEYNLETGRSVLTNGADAVTGTSSGRVRGVFVPNQEPKK